MVCHTLSAGIPTIPLPSPHRSRPSYSPGGAPHRRAPVRMNSFVKEPARLAAERQRLHGELVQASLEHYPVFIRCAAASAKATADTQACPGEHAGC